MKVSQNQLINDKKRSFYIKDTVTNFMTHFNDFDTNKEKEDFRLMIESMCYDKSILEYANKFDVYQLIAFD